VEHELEILGRLFDATFHKPTVWPVGEFCPFKGRVNQLASMFKLCYEVLNVWHVAKRGRGCQPTRLRMLYIHEV